MNIRIPMETDDWFKGTELVTSINSMSWFKVTLHETMCLKT
jgi:hypothetical protein